MPKEKRIHAVHRRNATKAVPPNLPNNVEVRRSTIPKAGNGLFAKERLRKGAVLGEYIGEVLTAKQAEGRDPSYFIYKDEGGAKKGAAAMVVDGRTYANPMRWLNHSAQPNAYAELQHDGRILFKTKKAVQPGQELFIDYGPDYQFS